MTFKGMQNPKKVKTVHYHPGCFNEQVNLMVMVRIRMLKVAVCRLCHQEMKYYQHSHDIE